MFTPVGFYKVIDDSWTPEELNGITHWWRADSGVTLSGGTVTDWVDQISGKTLTQEGSSTAPDYVSSDTTMNSKPAIEFGNGGTTTDALSDQANRLSVTSTDFPFAWYVFSTTDNARGGYQILGPDAGPDAANQELAIEFNHPSHANTISVYSYSIDGGGGITLTDVASRPDKGWVGIGTDNNDSNHPGYLWVNGTKQTLWTGGTYYWGERGNGIDLIVGNYGPSQTLGYVGRILEFGFGTEEPTDANRVELANYINDRYGLSLSSFGGVTDSLLVSYEAERVTDATFTDTSGNGNDGTKGTESGTGITWTEDSDGNYFTLNAMTSADTNYVDSGVKPSVSTAYSWDGIFETQPSSGGQTSTYRWTPWTSDDSGGNINLVTGFNKYQEVVLLHDGNELDGAADGFDFATIPNGSWFHFALTWDGTNARGYVNGTLVNTVSFPYAIDSTFPENLMIHRSGQNNRGSLFGFLGTLKMGAQTWYEKKLSDDEVSINYNYYKQFYTGL